MPLKATLVADGSSDRALKPLLEWLLAQNLPEGEAFEVVVADLSRLPKPPRSADSKLRIAWELYQGDVLFIHHDAEKERPEIRRHQIDTEVMAAFTTAPAYIKVVPVRMMEAWLLTDEYAIREAAGNPNGTTALNLPPANRLDTLPDPKEILLEALRKATGNNPRRLRAFRERKAVHRVAEFNRERGFDALVVIPAFALLEQEIIAFITSRFQTS